MAIQCNIDQRGRKVRVFAGALVESVGQLDVQLDELVQAAIEAETEREIQEFLLAQEEQTADVDGEELEVMPLSTTMRFSTTVCTLICSLQ